MKNIMKKFNKLSKKTKIITITILIITILIGTTIIFWGEEGNSTYDSTNTIKKITETETINTTEYIYNAVTQKETEGGKIKYYVAYEGTVKAGFEFDEMKINTNKKSKTVTITIPKIKVTETKINEKNLKFIFTKAKYDDKKVLEEAIELCKKDLETRAKETDLLFKTAQNNASSGIKAFLQPWINTLPEDYEIIFEQEVAKDEK